MLTSDFFVRRGFFIDRDFLSSEMCSSLLSEVHPATQVQAEVTGTASLVNEEIRSTKLAEVQSATKALLEERLMTLRPKLESHFNLTLTGCEAPQFLVYREGDFFQTHRDRSLMPEAPQYVQDRQLSVVIFLNGQAAAPGSDGYEGGALAFYGLIDEPRWKEFGFALSGEPGLLVVFPSDVFHGVTKVTHGERYTIVSWFF